MYSILAQEYAQLLIFACFALVVRCSDEDFSQTNQHVLEHELVKGKFTKRGLLTLMPGSSGSVLYNDEGQLSDADVKALLDLADRHDIYRLRVLSRSGGKADYVYGFMYACDLIHSRLNDNVSLSVNSHGIVVGIHAAARMQQQSASYEACSLRQEEHSLSSLPRAFSTRAALVRPSAGPAPETQLYVTRMEEEKRRKQEAEHGDNRSFLAKYWMYIVPAVLVYMVMSNADPNAQGGGGGGGG